MQPSYQSGFYAPGRGVAKHPEFWRGCVGAWNPGLGNTGLSLRDWSGNQNNGTLTNGPTWDVSDGRQSLSFDGVDDWIELGTPSSLYCTTFTLSAWITPVLQNNNKYAAIMGNADLAYNHANYVMNMWRSGSSDGNKAFAQGEFGGTWYTVTDTTVLVTRALTHIASTYNGSMLSIYRNGVKTASIAASGTPTTAGSNYRIGRTGLYPIYPATPSSTDVTWSGLMSDIFIHNRALSPSQIQTLATRPGIAYELAPRKTYFIPTSTSTSQFYDILSPLIFAGTN